MDGPSAFAGGAPRSWIESDAPPGKPSTFDCCANGGADHFLVEAQVGHVNFTDEVLRRSDSDWFWYLFLKPLATSLGLFGSLMLSFCRDVGSRRCAGAVEEPIAGLANTRPALPGASK
jgi:hypothetical protein